VFEPIELEGRTSMLGGVVEFDRRDNVFSPKRGVRAHLDYNVSAEGLGSDYDYQSAELFVHGWFPVKQGWVSGLRLQVDQVWGEPAFYQLPFIELRGIPFFRYQGEIAAVVETEQRIHLWRRWSTVAFVGAGRTADSWDDLSGGDTPYNLGFGPRYQLAKAFDLDLGLDVAWGPDSFGWYIVFGNAWLR
jgi:outer membrane translocation and assembly module TamA